MLAVSRRVTAAVPIGIGRVVARPVLTGAGSVSLLCRYYSKSSKPEPSRSNPFPIDTAHVREKHENAKLSRYQRWAKYLESEKFKKSMTKYYIGGFIAMCISLYYYMRDRYYEDIQLKHVRAKYEADPSSLLEYEYLMMKKLNNERLRPKEEKKWKIYQMMRKEFRRKNLLNKDAIFEPTPEQLDEWYQKQPRISSRKTPVLDQPIDKPDVVDDTKQESDKKTANIVPAEDTTSFYEEKAEAYDNEIKWEERAILMGRRRSWLMSQIQGDVLEVACGTGRNIPYLNTEDINSITFLDSSAKMVELAVKKFQSYYPKFKKVGYTVGKAEDLVDLVKDNKSIQYDTIIETFGLCAHEDPVKALKNMKELLKPGGRIVLLEHGRSTWGFINNHLDFRSEHRMKTWACRWNLDILDLVDSAGLDITYEKRVHLGTTYMLICKRPEDPINQSEKPFINKLFGSAPPKPIEKSK
ncbi:S-adenosyl-L-methionine-dependent methyltransferase [Scheffersomyces amazonensis]|uniref:S-adenosyl-L-methionine-dependent methyltransferase n=1 Tax=Scheffersomyces amazonensis TaxID=1078765 RepID=UPI00315D51DF